MRLVIQEHHARRLHWDFRIEMGGVYKSWAVPKSPLMPVGTSRLAIRVDDHPLQFGDFEGVIPKGNYGAGRIFVWDRGTWELISGSMAAGEIKFKVNGKKMNGEFVLVDVSGSEGYRANSWLLRRVK